LGGSQNWILVGGPPCQAYSLIGRVKIKNESKKKQRDFDKDHRHFLYREYLKIIAVHRPPVFVVENVPGILSSKVNGTNTFEMILRDLRNPSHAISELNGNSIFDCQSEALCYEIYSLVKKCNNGTELKPSDYIIKQKILVYLKPDTELFCWGLDPILRQNLSNLPTQRR
jgi:DNA (cytosine-5)-methyltransferase 1